MESQPASAPTSSFNRSLLLAELDVDLRPANYGVDDDRHIVENKATRVLYSKSKVINLKIVSDAQTNRYSDLKNRDANLDSI